MKESFEFAMLITFTLKSWFILFKRQGFFSQVYTAISRKVVEKYVHATIPRGSLGYVQYTVPDTVAVEPTFVAFL